MGMSTLTSLSTLPSSPTRGPQAALLRTRLIVPQPPST